MTESSDQETSRIIRQDGSSGGDISPADSSDLAAINENLTERIRLAETPKEIREYLKLRDELQDQALRQIELETVKIKVEEAKNQITFNRRLTIAREVRTIVASTITVSIGLYLVSSSPIVSALLIILGLAKPLEYSVSEVSELMAQLRNLFIKDARDFQEKESRGDKQNERRD